MEPTQREMRALRTTAKDLLRIACIAGNVSYFEGAREKYTRLRDVSTRISKMALTSSQKQDLKFALEILADKKSNVLAHRKSVGRCGQCLFHSKLIAASTNNHKKADQ